MRVAPGKASHPYPTYLKRMLYRMPPITTPWKSRSNHVQVTLETISQRGLDTNYQLVIKEDSEAEKNLTAATEAKKSYQDTEENPPVIKLWKKANSAKTHTSKAIASAIQGGGSTSFLCLWQLMPHLILMSTGLNTPRSMQRHGPPSWSVFNCTPRLYSGMMHDAAEMQRF